MKKQCWSFRLGLIEFSFSPAILPQHASSRSTSLFDCQPLLATVTPATPDTEKNSPRIHSYCRYKEGGIREGCHFPLLFWLGPTQYSNIPTQPQHISLMSDCAISVTFFRKVSCTCSWVHWRIRQTAECFIIVSQQPCVRFTASVWNGLLEPPCENQEQLLLDVAPCTKRRHTLATLNVQKCGLTSS